MSKAQIPVKYLDIAEYMYINLAKGLIQSNSFLLAYASKPNFHMMQLIDLMGTLGMHSSFFISTSSTIITLNIGTH